MVLVKGSSSRESIGGEFNIHGYNNVVYEVSFDFHSLRSDFSSLIDFSAFKGSSNLLANMAKKVSESIVALMMVVVVKARTS